MTRISAPDLARRGLAERRHSLYSSAALAALDTGRATLDSTLPGVHARLLSEIPSSGNGRKSAGNPLSSFEQNATREIWRFLCLVEIANFAQLRRHLGRLRADRLVLDVADKIAADLPRARLVSVGRATLELALGGSIRADIDPVLASLRKLFDKPIDIDGEMHRIDLLIGVAAGPATHADDVRLAEEAEEAIDLARKEQRIVVRDLLEGTPAFDRLTLIRDLGGALANGEMFLQYQPKMHLRRQEVDSAEALIRWQHPTRGLILPGDFIQAAEESREISAMTLWTLEQVMIDQRMLAAQGHDITLFVNISGQLLGDPQFVDQVRGMFHDSHARIGFEITETSVIRDPETAIAHLRAFADIGIPIAIDDYGAGLSSLAYLKQLPARELKIDKMFVLQLTSSNRDPLIVRSTIDLAHALEMEVTAEGVESQAALALLSVMGCDIAQGFLISRPVSIEALRNFLEEERPAAITAPPRPNFDRPASFWKSA